MTESNSNTMRWQLNRKINLTVFVQLIFLATLIVGTWVNLQRQLCIVQHDIGLLIQAQEKSQKKLEEVTEKTISHEYRLRSVEKCISKTNTASSSF